MEATGGGGRVKAQTSLKQIDNPRRNIHVLNIVLDHNNRMPRACKVENEIASDEEQTEGKIMTVNNEELAE
jgi:hypothetical protein